jgi:hypothetical protein
MKNLLRNIMAACELNAKTAKIRRLKRTISEIEGDIRYNKECIERYKAMMAEVDGNQLDLFIQE